MTAGSYDAIPYRGTAVPLSAPAHLALCATWHRGLRPRTTGMRVVELGCGDGANLLPMAFYDPESTFIGVDDCPVHVDRARHVAAGLGLANVIFLRKDIRELQPQQCGPADYVIAHGVYSWVTEDVRRALLRFCRGTLVPEGVAYVSYNAQPGWAMRRLVREMLRRSAAVRKAALEDKPQRAMEVAAQLLDDLPSRDYAFAALLAPELERVRDGKAFYVFHEYLTDVNEGFWLRDFVDEAQRHGLDYVGDAQFCRWEGHVPDSLARTVAKRHPDHVEQEEAADLLGNRYFHASILCHVDAARSPVCHADLLDEVSIATSLVAESGLLDLTDGVVEGFRRDRGPEITLDAAITKAAMALLAAKWPAGARFDEVFQQSIRLLRRHGTEVVANARLQLSEELTTLFRIGQVDLRVREDGVQATDEASPSASRLARYEAEHREAVTTKYHLALPLDGDTLRLISSLDGSRSRAQLHERFGADLVERMLPTLGRWGLLDVSRRRSEIGRRQPALPVPVELPHRWQ